MIAIAGANAHGAGLGAQLPGLPPPSSVAKRRAVFGARAISRSAVPHWRCSDMTPTHARAAVVITQGAHVTAIAGANAHGAGLGAGARLRSSASSACTIKHRAVPARALYDAVPSHTGCAPAVPPPHARAAVAFTRGAHDTAIAGVNAHGAGMGADAHLPGLPLSSYFAKRRAVPGARALSCRAVPHRRCSGRASSVFLRCRGNHARSACDRHRWGQCTQNGHGGWRPPPELSSVGIRYLASRRTGACALS